MCIDVCGISLGDSWGIGGLLCINQLNVGLLGWYLQVNIQQVKLLLVQFNCISMVVVGLNYWLDFDFFFMVNVGCECNDFFGLGSQSGVMGGVIVEWMLILRICVNVNW